MGSIKLWIEFGHPNFGQHICFDVLSLWKALTFAPKIELIKWIDEGKTCSMATKKITCFAENYHFDYYNSA